MNITLIGMPGAGKSTVGVLLAKSMLMDFVDTDLLIQRKHGMSLCEFIEKYGEEEFKKAENDVISSLECENTVIATGGLSKFIVPYCKREIIYDDSLLLKGLWIIYKKNVK